MTAFSKLFDVSLQKNHLNFQEIPTETVDEPVPSQEEEEETSEETDPLAAFLKYFEQEARRMAEIRAADSSEEPEGEAAQLPADVDMPEANFKPAALTV